MADLHPLDLADQRNNPDALTRRHISLRRLARAAYYALVAYAAIWCAVQGYWTVDYVQTQIAIVGER